jgi:predicted nucleotidyltransferase component of viral defense system
MVDMITPQPKDAMHKAWLYRVLTGIYDDADLAKVLYFKGGTCAAMLGYLDRFSVDLDFDYVGAADAVTNTRKSLEKTFADVGLTIHDQSKTVPQYFLKYPAVHGERNTMKIDVAISPPQANRYEPKRLHEIDRIITCQTIETMMANKLVALMDRYERNESIAARDVYDIHHFFLQGYRYDEAILVERTNKHAKDFFTGLIAFVEEHITDDIINQDLNMLLTHEHFSRVRKILKRETLMFLRDELQRVIAK